MAPPTCEQAPPGAPAPICSSARWRPWPARAAVVVLGLGAVSTIRALRPIFRASDAAHHSRSAGWWLLLGRPGRRFQPGVQGAVAAPGHARPGPDRMILGRAGIRLAIR